MLSGCNGDFQPNVKGRKPPKFPIIAKFYPPTGGVIPDA